MYDWQVPGTFHVDTYNHFLGVPVLGHVLAMVSFPPMTLSKIETGCDRYTAVSPGSL